MRVLSFIVLSFLTLILSAGGACAGSVHAILVGAAEYPGLPPERQLKGPPNDVTLMRQVLAARGVPPENVTVLADQIEGAAPPDRDAILASFAALTGRLRRGDTVLFFFAGHGSLVPAEDGGAETGGDDRILLTRDTGSESGRSARGLTDRVLARAITAMRNTGADVWAVVDACHSARSIRGAGRDVRIRGVPPSVLGIARPATSRGGARGGDAAVRGSALVAPAAALAPDAGRLIAFYAAQGDQAAPEQELLVSGRGRQYHGRFTHALATALLGRADLTYGQLAQQILVDYAATSMAVIPLFEGASDDLPVLGSATTRTDRQWQYLRANESLSLAAGQLHRVGVGTIVALLSSAGARTEDAVAYAKVVENAALSSRLEGVAFAGKPASAAAAAKPNGIARLVQPALDLELRVAVAPPPAKPTGQERRLLQVIDMVRERGVAGASIAWMPGGAGAEVELVVADGRLRLLPRFDGSAVEVPSAGVVALNGANGTIEEMAEALTERLRRQARLASLLRVSSMLGIETKLDGFDIRATARRSLDGSSLLDCAQARREPERPFAITDRIRFGQCDEITFDVVNNSSTALDVTVLFVSSDQELQLAFPKPGRTPRIDAKERRKLTFRIRTVEADGRPSTIGLERLVFIAVQAGTAGQANSGQPEVSDFSFLADPTGGTRRPPSRENLHGLDTLLAMAIFGPQVRGPNYRPSAEELATVRVAAWQAGGLAP